MVQPLGAGFVPLRVGGVRGLPAHRCGDRRQDILRSFGTAVCRGVGRNAGRPSWPGVGRGKTCRHKCSRALPWVRGGAQLRMVRGGAQLRLGAGPVAGRPGGARRRTRGLDLGDPPSAGQRQWRPGRRRILPAGFGCAVPPTLWCRNLTDRTRGCAVCQVELTTPRRLAPCCVGLPEVGQRKRWWALCRRIRRAAAISAQLCAVTPVHGTQCSIC
jgi:hypothetical protein